ncbi:hypothetical protein [Rodentibacter pneumotropicus]|uniref:hypothetical protein n=1 Tax=Rodentibacter pneumotropicus TaxID=758 RepID=UPI00036D6C0E|nr:hypothetical protein [Rodentibacter pneumotropicus]MDC2824904.1 hypothetical protein [Rodentibacter pneumotropicus]NBH75781.1 hypothetical protein [Rodentibacter pneumotropicus]OOF61045.1 hypothetical protein BH925_03495 [Rodentibacter pneumotropicus]THA02100.1 hypothetical protein D3M72_06570 [Rodentibacter pneumotropicus]THA06384.1 hypothetical protein D3M73_04720 [Rodentibacter pneumotropicus]
MTALFNLFYIYDPWFFHVMRMSVIVGGGAFVVLIYRYVKKQNRQGIIVPMDSLAVLLGLILFSVIPLLINGTRDFSVIAMYVKSLILFIFGIGFYNAFYAIPSRQQRLVRDLQIGVAVQFVFGVLALLGVSFLVDFLLSTNAILPARFYGSEQEYRLYNITATAFFQLSLFYLMLFHFLLAYNAKHNSMPSILVFLMLCIGLISGRTFLLLSVVSITLYFKWRYIPSLIAFLLVVLGLAFFMPKNPYVAHALEPVINLLHGAGFASSSTDTLVKDHLFMPTLKQFISGDGMYMTGQLDVGRYYGNTDSGFLRQILYGGVVYALVCFFVTFYFVRKVALNWFDGSWKFILSAFVILAACNIKADTFAFPGIMFVMLMFLSLFGVHGKQRIFLVQNEEKNV